MNQPTASQTLMRDRFWRLHPSHAIATYKLAAFLALLAIIQLLAWWIPRTPYHDGIPSYLALHSLMETVSVVVAMMVFSVGWNYRQSGNTRNLVLLACFFFSVGVLDFLHMVSYAGMPEFITQNDTDKHLNFWLGARFLASLALLFVSVNSWEQRVSRQFQYTLFTVLTAGTCVLVFLVIFHQELFPHWFIPGQGLTPLKKWLEYGFIALNIASAVVLWIKMRDAKSFKAPLLFAAVCTMAMSEFFLHSMQRSLVPTSYWGTSIKSLAITSFTVPLSLKQLNAPI